MKFSLGLPKFHRLKRSNWCQEEDATSVDTQIFYTSFHMTAPTLGFFPGVLELSHRSGIHDPSSV